ncbi:MAG TPA: serine hydrolase domain-containing protein [Candidatus Acidoferrum sp.]|nr:serine hydrolase domain-containing protein [Candidatus Acidoferrum sp.]
MLGLGALAAGVLGAWATGPSIGLTQAPVAEWSDGRAPELEPLIRKHCAPFISEGNTLGLAVAAVTPTNATIMTFGLPALGSSAPTGPDTLFELGSITKTFTALVLACEIEHGRLRLDDPVQQLLPSGVRLPEAARGITLRNLTTHTSGFPHLPAGFSSARSIGMLLFGTDPYVGYSQADLLRDVQSVKLQSKPGAKASYSNYGMMLLGDLLAREVGCTYEELVKREVCLPLGMTNTTITLQPGQRRRTAQAYRAVLRCGPLTLALRSAPWLEGNPLGGAGGLRSTASDMLKYLRANMHPEGQPLANALRQSHRALFKENDHTSFGMNWVISNQSHQMVIWHNGGTGGFRSYLGFTADGRVGVLVLSNSSEDVDGLAEDLLHELQ